MNIAIATPRFKASRNEAISKNIINLSEGLNKKGHSVTCFLSETYHSKNNINYVTYRKSKSYKSLFDSFLNLVSMCLTLRREEKFDHYNIQIATIIELIIISILLPEKIKNKSSITINQIHLSFENFKKNKKEIILNLNLYWYFITFNSFFLSFSLKPLLKKYNSTIVNSKYQYNLFKEMGIRNLFIISPSIFEKTIHRNKKSCDNKVLNIIHIGHNKKIKGIDKIISIAEKLRNEKINFKITLCISDYDKKRNFKIEKKIKNLQLSNVIKIKGNVNVHQELINQHIFIYPLRSCLGTTMLPNSLIEAISVGVTPLIPFHEELSHDINYKKILKMEKNKTISTILDYHRDFKKKNESYDWMESFFLEDFNVNEYIDKYCNLILNQNVKLDRDFEGNLVREKKPN